jgi:hypothetical protein
MTKQDFTATLLVTQAPSQVFHAINNPRAWWSGEITGNTLLLNDEFTYRYKDFHMSKQRIVEMIPDKKVVWLVTESQINYAEDRMEWTGTKIIFDISKKDDKTQLTFTHQGLNANIECFDSCSNSWTQLIQQGLRTLVATGKSNLVILAGTPTTREIATRFNELAQQEKWFEIQDEFFADNVKSTDPPNSPYLSFAEGKHPVRKKGEDFVKKIEAVHGARTGEPIVNGNHFAVTRSLDITVHGHGRFQWDQIMLYEVKDGQIISEQFFY